MGLNWVVEENGTYGVGQPVIIVFDGQVTNQAAAEAALKVTTDKGDLVGSWGWLQDEDISGKGLQSQVHWRPKDFWPANTKVTVQADMYGVDFGNGSWGGADVARNFAIGRSLIVTADVNSFRLKVAAGRRRGPRLPGVLRQGRRRPRHPQRHPPGAAEVARVRDVQRRGSTTAASR